MKVPKVLIVAGLTPIAKGGWGGQLSVASSLVRSPLSVVVKIIPLSTTIRSVPPPPLVVRIWDGLVRFQRFIGKLVPCDAVFIFLTDGMGLLEKGLLAHIAAFAGKGVVVRFGSGALPSQCARYPVMKYYLRLVLRSADVVCSQGPFWTRYFGQFPEARGKVIEIPNGVALGPLPHRDRSMTTGHRIVFVGWMQRHKGIFDALEGFKIVRHSYPDAVLTLVGGGGDIEEFREAAIQADVLQSVRILGWVPKESVRQILSQNDVFLLPSHHEGLPNALLEAMAAGLPVVATGVGSIPDVVDANCGILVPVRDVVAIAGAIERLFSDRDFATRLGANARQTIGSRYDERKMWPLYAEAVTRATGTPISLPPCNEKD